MLGSIVPSLAVTAFAMVTAVSAEDDPKPGVLVPPYNGGRSLLNRLDRRDVCPSSYGSCDGTAYWCCPTDTSCYTDSSGGECCCYDYGYGCSGTCPPPTYYYSYSYYSYYYSYSYYSPQYTPTTIYSNPPAVTSAPAFTLYTTYDSYYTASWTLTWYYTWYYYYSYAATYYVTYSTYYDYTTIYATATDLSEASSSLSSISDAITYYTSPEATSLESLYTPISTPPPAISNSAAFTGFGGSSALPTGSGKLNTLGGGGGGGGSRTRNSATTTPAASQSQSASQSIFGGEGSRVGPSSGLGLWVFAVLAMVPAALMLWL